MKIHSMVRGHVRTDYKEITIIPSRYFSYPLSYKQPIYSYTVFLGFYLSLKLCFYREVVYIETVYMYIYY